MYFEEGRNEKEIFADIPNGLAKAFDCISHKVL